MGHDACGICQGDHHYTDHADWRQQFGERWDGLTEHVQRERFLAATAAERTIMLYQGIVEAATAAKWLGMPVEGVERFIAEMRQPNMFGRLAHHGETVLATPPPGTVAVVTQGPGVDHGGYLVPVDGFSRDHDVDVTAIGDRERRFVPSGQRRQHVTVAEARERLGFGSKDERYCGACQPQDYRWPVMTRPDGTRYRACHCEAELTPAPPVSCRNCTLASDSPAFGYLTPIGTPRLVNGLCYWCALIKPRPPAPAPKPAWWRQRANVPPLVAIVTGLILLVCVVAMS